MIGDARISMNTLMDCYSISRPSDSLLGFVVLMQVVGVD